MKAHAVLRFAVVVALTALGAACGANSDGGEDGSVAPVDSVLSAPDQALLGPDAVHVNERFRLSAVAYASSGLQLPGDLALDGGNNLYVLDLAPPARVVKFDSAGRYVERYSSRWAENEGVIAFTQGFSVSDWNVFFVIDKSTNMLHAYLLNLGTETGSTRIDGVPIDLLPLPEFNEFYLHKWDPERGTSYVMRARTPLDSLSVTYQVSTTPEQSLQKAMRDVYFLTEVDHRGQLYVAFQDDYPVRVLTAEGETVRLIGIQRDRVAKTPAEIDAERIVNRTRFDAMAPDLPEELRAEAAEPDSLVPLVQELEVDPAGRLWVRTSRADAAGTTPFDVFNERGQYLARVDVPGEVERITFAPDGALYVIDVTSATSPTVVGYDVSLGVALSP